MVNFPMPPKLYFLEKRFQIYCNFVTVLLCVCSKTMAKMAVARIKLLRNKREVVVRQMRRDIAMLLESRQDATARIRVIFPFSEFFSFFMFLYNLWILKWGWCVVDWLIQWCVCNLEISSIWQFFWVIEWGICYIMSRGKLYCYCLELVMKPLWII